MNVKDEMNDIKDTSRSDISQNTNIKVFNGFSNDENGNIDRIAQLNKPKKRNSPTNKKSNNSNKQIFSVLRSLPVTQETTTYKNPIIDIISFGNGNLFQNNLNNNNNQNKENISNSPSHKQNKEEDNESNASKHSKNSKNSYNSIRSMSVNDPNENINTFLTTEGISDPCNNLDPLARTNISDPKDNLFSKIRHNLEEKETIQPSNSIDNNEKVSKVIHCKLGNKVVDSFTVSTIEKGVALLVSNEDCIFTLPIFLLPKGVKAGNIYTFSIEVEDTKEECEDYIKEIQKNFLINKKN